MSSDESFLYFALAIVAGLLVWVGWGGWKLNTGKKFFVAALLAGLLFFASDTQSNYLTPLPMRELGFYVGIASILIVAGALGNVLFSSIDFEKASILKKFGISSVIGFGNYIVSATLLDVAVTSGAMSSLVVAGVVTALGIAKV